MPNTRALIVLLFVTSLHASGARAQSWGSGFEDGFPTAEWHGFQHRAWQPDGPFNFRSDCPPAQDQWNCHWWIDCSNPSDCEFRAKLCGAREESCRAYPVVHWDEQAPGHQIDLPFCVSHQLWLDFDWDAWPDGGWYSPNTITTNKGSWPAGRSSIFTIGKGGRLGSAHVPVTCNTDPMPLREWFAYSECYGPSNDQPWQVQIFVNGERWCEGTDDFTGPAQAGHWGLYSWGITSGEVRNDDFVLTNLQSWPPSFTPGNGTPKPGSSRGSDSGDGCNAFRIQPLGPGLLLLACPILLRRRRK